MESIFPFNGVDVEGTWYRPVPGQQKPYQCHIRRLARAQIHVTYIFNTTCIYCKSTMPDLDPGIPRLPRRNGEVFDTDGAVVAGFWQCGTLQWDELYRYLLKFVVSAVPWRIFQYDLTQQQHGAPCPSSAQIVQTGHYILLSSVGESVRIGLVATLPRPRIPTISNTPSCGYDYRTRGRARDGKCLITGLQTETYSRLKVAHIFPRAHDTEWVRKGYPSRITDTADQAVMGGAIKIDSVQNVITLRSDLHDAWDNYEFGIDPNNNYRITSFTNGNQDINGLFLQLDHIQDPTLRPLDSLFLDHFMQGIFKHMKGAGEPEGRSRDYDDAFGEGSLNLSNTESWNTKEGKERFELVLVDRLFDHRLLQQTTTEN